MENTASSCLKCFQIPTRSTVRQGLMHMLGMELKHTHLNPYKSACKTISRAHRSRRARLWSTRANSAWTLLRLVCRKRALSFAMCNLTGHGGTPVIHTMYHDPVSKQQKHSLVFIRVLFPLSDTWLNEITANPDTGPNWASHENQSLTPHPKIQPQACDSRWTMRHEPGPGWSQTRRVGVWCCGRTAIKLQTAGKVTEQQQHKATTGLHAHPSTWPVATHHLISADPADIQIVPACKAPWHKHNTCQHETQVLTWYTWNALAALPRRNTDGIQTLINARLDLTRIKRWKWPFLLIKKKKQVKRLYSPLKGISNKSFIQQIKSYLTVR